jgi:heme/copper-type cytochrome/quinol oxidase subunit 4
MTSHHNSAVDTYGSGHGTYKSYIIGFILSILLTILPYLIVVNHLLVHNYIYSESYYCCLSIAICTEKM